MIAPTAEQQELLRRAARGLAAAGLIHAYGHCSLRLDAGHFLVCAPLPMGVIRYEPGTVVSLDAPLPDGVLGEVRAHREIYRKRPDVGGICRTMPPSLMALSTQCIVPRPRHGIGAYFAPAPIFWDDPRLLRSDAAAAELAAALGGARAIVMRGNGAITVGDTIEQAACFAYFLEDAAQLEHDVRSMGFDPGKGLLDIDEIAARQTLAGGVIERMWTWLTRADAVPTL